MIYPSASAFRMMSPADFASFWRAAEAFKIEGIYIYGNEVTEIIALHEAGWRLDFVYAGASPFQWGWRRPPRPGTKDRIGRRFASTEVAYRHLTGQWITPEHPNKAYFSSLKPQARA